MVDPREPQVLERVPRVSQSSARRSASAGSSRAVADRLEKARSEAIGCRGGICLMASTGFPFDSVRSRSLEWWVVLPARLPHSMIAARDADSRRLLLRPEHPRDLRVAPLLPRLPVHEAQGPRARSAAAAGRVWPVGHDPAPDLQRDVRRRSADRRGVRDRLPEGPARDPGARRLDGRDARHRRAGGAAAGGARVRHQVSASRRTARATRPARSSRASRSRAASSSRSSTPTSCRRRTSCGGPSPYLRGRRSSRSCRRAGAISTRTTRC